MWSSCHAGSSETEQDVSAVSTGDDQRPLPGGGQARQRVSEGPRRDDELQTQIYVSFCCSFCYRESASKPFSVLSLKWVVG